MAQYIPVNSIQSQQSREARKRASLPPALGVGSILCPRGAPHLPEPPDVVEGLEGTLKVEAEPGEEGLHGPRTLPFCGERSRVPWSGEQEIKQRQTDEAKQLSA